MTRTLAVGALLLATILACGQEAPRASPTTLATYPHAMDRLARLMRAELTDSQPARVFQAFSCEHDRVEHVLGPDLEVRLRLLKDSVAAETTPEVARLHDARINGAVIYSGDNPLCGPINVEAERELPLPAHMKHGIPAKPTRLPTDSGAQR